MYNGNDQSYCLKNDFSKLNEQKDTRWLRADQLFWPISLGSSEMQYHHIIHSAITGFFTRRLPNSHYSKKLELRRVIGSEDLDYFAFPSEKPQWLIHAHLLEHGRGWRSWSIGWLEDVEGGLLKHEALLQYLDPTNPLCCALALEDAFLERINQVGWP